MILCTPINSIWICWVNQVASKNRSSFVQTRKAMSKTITPPVGYKAVTGNCSLPEKIVNKKDNEIWLIRAPKDVWLL